MIRATLGDIELHFIPIQAEVHSQSENMTLHQMTERSWAWLADTPGPGAPNAGVIADDDGLTIVDSLLTPTQAQPLAAAVEPLGLPIRRLVYSSSHLPHVGGSSVFALPAIYGSAQISAHMDQPVNVASAMAMYPDHEAPLGDLAEAGTRPVTHTIVEGAWLSPTVGAAPLHGEIDQNLIVQMPEERIVFAGAAASFGVTPMAGTGDPAGWADSLDTLLAWGDVFVPGHGSVGGAEQIQDLQAYLRACVAAEGDPGALADGPWTEWSGRHYDQINIERAALLSEGRDEPAPSLLRLLNLR